MFALRENSSRPLPPPSLFFSSKPSGLMTTPSPLFYFPQVKPQVKKTRTNVHLRYQMMVWGNKNCWKISFVVITFLDNTIFHPFTRTKMLFSSSLVNQAPSPPAHFPQVFPQVSCFPEVQTKRTWGIYLWSLTLNKVIKLVN